MLGELCHSSTINNRVSLRWTHFYHAIYYVNIVVCPSENHNLDKQLTAMMISLCLLWNKPSSSQWSCVVGLDEYPKGHSVSLPRSYLRAGELLPCCKNEPKIQKMWLGSSSPGTAFSLKYFDFLTRAACLHLHPGSITSEGRSSHHGKNTAMHGHSFPFLHHAQA